MRRGRRRNRRVEAHGVAHVNASFNNTIVTLSDREGRVISWSSTGKVGFKGSRKARPMLLSWLPLMQREKPWQWVCVGWKSGSKAWRWARSRRAIATGAGLEISAIKDVTPIPHNGCRPPKRRRV